VSLYVSVNTPQSDMANSPIDEAITFIAAHAAAENRLGHIPAGPSLDITFMLSSKKDAPHFAGMRMGGYNMEGDTLFFEVAVPESMTQSRGAPRYVAAVMQDMVENADSYFSEMGIEFDLTNWQRVMEDLTGLATGEAVEH
jgi:hypothetical protein